jgi:hypothetical protein
MKTKSLLAVTAALVTMGSVSSASARSHDLVNQALDKTLSEHARVERSYEEKVDRARDDFREKNERGIEVVLDGEIGGKSAGRIRGYDGTDRTFREKNVDAKLAAEIKDIDSSLEESVQREARAERFNTRERDVVVTAKRKRE